MHAFFAALTNERWLVRLTGESWRRKRLAGVGVQSSKRVDSVEQVGLECSAVIFRVGLRGRKRSLRVSMCCEKQVCVMLS